jgi:hypothetical protein
LLKSSPWPNETFFLATTKNGEEPKNDYLRGPVLFGNQILAK